MTKPRLATLNVNGNLEEGLKNTVHVRDLAPFFVDEPERLGGTNAGPNPLEYFLGAYSACTSIMTSYAAKDLNFTYTGLDFDTNGSLDPRGFKGVEGIQTYFQTVTIQVEVETEESEEALKQLKETVEKRCPLHNLLVDAGVEVHSQWTIKSK
ncbi:OsmC family protein [Allobacillus halotolerans]|uniref:OsmC family protein n=1 Tax=Allobacillus halotolerans TaxID=570278 RepID=A0ABS6GSA4_9BACI|nr:OsmC family protein [Allobacillus halotolerans]MBU6082019.1 OsmC family protein [Allobacillus halotolerans]